MWDAEDFDPEVDFFDLEDMLASRYWLKRLEAAGKLTEEEKRKLNEIEADFERKGIPEFVESKFPAVYDRWIRRAPVGLLELFALIHRSQLFNEMTILGDLCRFIDSENFITPHWKRGRNENKEIQQFAA